MPLAVLCQVIGLPEVLVFFVSGIAIIPLAGLMGQATEQLTHRVGPGVGGLLNATFGNAAELIIGIMALLSGHVEVVKASLTGSIIGNGLLILGLAMFLGGLKRTHQTFSKGAAQTSSSVLFLSVVGLLVPSLLAMLHPGAVAEAERMSEGIALVLLLVYAASLVFSLRTHAHLYEVEEGGAPEGEPWSRGRAVAVLLVATAVTAVMAEIFVGAIEETTRVLGLSEVFTGVIVVALVGNAAEHSSAVLMAIGDRMTLALTIAMESSKQIALFVAPFLVLAGWALGRPMDLVFTQLEIVAVAVSVGAVALIARDGESNWFEGIQLLAVYTILAIGFYFV